MSIIAINDFISQDGGIVKTIYSNSIALANLTLADNSASDELKAMTEQIKMQNEVFYRAYQKMQAEQGSDKTDSSK